MKIAIITFHCAYNFGSALQAVALKCYLERMGNNVSIIDYRGRDFDQYVLFRSTFGLKAFLSDIVFAKGNLERRSSFESFMSGHMNLTRLYTWRDEDSMSELVDEFDCFVCGSDQIWNLDCTGGPVGPYFLNFADGKRRIAYAPSLAHTSFRRENFDDVAKRQISAWLSDFNAISVREKSTIHLFQPLVDKPIEVCLDPTLLLDHSDYEPIISVSKSVGDLSGSLFVYMLECNDSLISYADHLACEMGCSIVYVSRKRLSFSVSSRNLYGIGPAEFLACVEGCKAVVTNSFHATVFSLIFNKPFQTLITRTSGSRMVELLENLGLSGHIVNGLHLSEPDAPGSDEVVRSLATLRTSSEAFISRSLGEA